MSIILGITAGVLLLLTVVPLYQTEIWWIRVLDFPRLQLALFALLLLAVSLSVELNAPANWMLPVVSGFCLAFHTWWILPLTWLYSPEIKTSGTSTSESSLRIITANVLIDNRNTEAFLEIIRNNDPDLFVTLESDEKWEKELDKLENQYPYSQKCPLDNSYGMHVYSRFPLKNCSINYLVEEGIPSIHARLILPGGKHVQMHFVHPSPPVPGFGNRESTERDAELLIVGEKVSETNSPVIVAGDLNDVAWSETTRLFKKISNLLDPRIGRGMYNTFSADYWFLRWPVDYFFVSRHFTLLNIRRLPYFGSDHFPIMVELSLDGSSSDESINRADQRDRDKVKEKKEQVSADKEDVPTP